MPRPLGPFRGRNATLPSPPTRLVPGAEITLEANPDDVTPDRLATWRGIGINRLSLGVQTFHPRGLHKLTRTHTPAGAIQACVTARAVFPNCNLDLIYGWDGQTDGDWLRDLQVAIELEMAHLSLYTLTYETRTPLGRQARRGVVEI